MLRRVIEPDVCHETQFVARAVEIDYRNAVSENVVDPANLFRLGVDEQGVIQKSLIETVARPEHQPVLAERHRLRITIDGRVLD